MIGYPHAKRGAFRAIAITVVLVSMAAPGLAKSRKSKTEPAPVASPLRSSETFTPFPSSPGESGLDIWSDPVFQKQFIAGYGINAEVEPRVTPEEIAVLEQVRPLMPGDLAQAERILLDALKPESTAVFDFTLGGIYFQRDKMPQALENYQKAVTKFPSFRRAWRNLGLIHARDARFDEAISAFTKLIELGGGDSYSYGLLGFAYSSKEDYQAAEAAYRNALLLQPENTEWRLGVTRCVFKQQKFEEAASLLENLIVRFPDKPDFWLLQAQAYLGMKQPLKAAQDLEALDLLGKSSVDSLHTLGDIYSNENLMDMAADAYMRAIDVTGDQPLDRPLRAAEALAARGAAPQAQKLVAHIEDAWRSRLDEKDRRKVLKLQARLSMAKGESSDQTAELLEEIVKLDPLDGEALMLLGQHYLRNEDPERAIFYYERAESIEAFEATAKIRHAQALVGIGRYADAVPLLRRAQEIKPRDDVAQYLSQIERIARTR